MFLKEHKVLVNELKLEFWHHWFFPQKNNNKNIRRIQEMKMDFGLTTFV